MCKKVTEETASILHVCIMDFRDGRSIGSDFQRSFEVDWEELMTEVQADWQEEQLSVEPQFLQLRWGKTVAAAIARLSDFVISRIGGATILPLRTSPLASPDRRLVPSW